MTTAGVVLHGSTPPYAELKLYL